MGPENRPVTPVPAAREIESPLLHPTSPVGIGQPVGEPHSGVIQRQNPHRRVFVCHTVVTDRGCRPNRGPRRSGWRRLLQPEWLPADFHRIGGKPAIEKLMLLILNDDQAAAAGVLQKTPVVHREGRISLVGPRTHDDGVIAAEVPSFQRRRPQDCYRNSHSLERLGYLIRRSPDVPHPSQSGENQRSDAKRRGRPAGVCARSDVRIIDGEDADIVRHTLVPCHGPDLGAARSEPGR
jgi:hypothetical protein